MPDFLNNPLIQYGSLGLAFVLALAFIRAFFALLAQRHEIQQSFFEHHGERERAFTEQFIACVDRNSAALEKVEHSMQRIQIQLARSELAGDATIHLELDR